MDIVTFKEYMEEKAKFHIKHGKYEEFATSSNITHAKYIYFDDGAVWYEVSTVVEEEINGEKYGVKYSFPLQIIKTEYWTSENSVSKFVFERG